MNPNDLIDERTRQAKSLEEGAATLAILFSDGYNVLPDGRLYNIKELVARTGGLTIHVYANEHPPPHFHVCAGDLDVSFSILDGEVTEGRIDGRRRRLVAWWYARSRPLLIETWNRTRPIDCPVGPVNA